MKVKVKKATKATKATTKATTRTARTARRESGKESLEELFDRRLLFVKAVFLLMFFVLAVRAVDLTVMQGDVLRHRADAQHKKRVTVPARRGAILDREGRILAISLPVASLSVDMGDKKLRKPAVLAKRLAPLLGFSEAWLRRRLARYRPGTFPVLKRKLSPDEEHRIRALKEPGLFFQPEMDRFYPFGEVTAHLLGFVNMDGEGREGLERAFEHHLKGVFGAKIIQRDNLGRVMPEVTTLSEAVPGKDLVLTIHAAIQYIAYRSLLKAMKKTGAAAGSVIVQDPRNGEILALANLPGFNPNNLSKSRADGRRNRAVMDAYEPGSTFKVFTIAAALDQGTVFAETRIDCENGSFRVDDRRIRDHKKYGLLTVSKVLQKSSNIGTAKIALALGYEQHSAYLHTFGFGNPTGVALNVEAKGKIPDISHYKRVGLANRAFGQGITATPLQITTAISAAVNGGVLYTPRLTLKEEVSAPRRVIQQKTSRTIRNMLEGVVDEDGTAPEAAVTGYRVGGKTGTAQKASRGRYVSGSYYSSFTGFAPVEQPRIVIFVGLDEPQGAYYGGLVAAPVFREISEEILPLLGVLPERPHHPELPSIREVSATVDDRALLEKILKRSSQ